MDTNKKKATFVTGEVVEGEEIFNVDSTKDKKDDDEDKEEK